MTPFRSGESGARDWLRINELNADHRDTRSRVVELEARANGQHRQPMVRGRFFPFRIYSIFSEPMAPATDWLLFRVRAGQVMGVNATGTDGNNADADEEDLLNADSVVAANITAESNCEAFWFWLEVTLDDDGDVTAAIVRYGPDPTAESYNGGAEPGQAWESDDPWLNYPTPDSTHIPIGFVDTKTGLADKLPTVRQILRADVIGSLGGSVCPP